MPGGQLRIMLDANVWLDFFIPGRASSATASRLIRGAVERNAELLYPSHIIEDLFYEIRRDAAEWTRAGAGEVSREAARYCHDYAWGCMEDLHELATAVATDDNLVLVAAQRAGVDYLVTSDNVMLNKATVAALAPQDMLSVLEVGL